MKKTILANTSNALSRAFTMVHVALDVAQVPDKHPMRVRVAAAFEDLEESLKQLPRNGRNAAAMLHPGPAVFVEPERDMRYWPTTDGLPAVQAIVPRSRRASRVAGKGITLRAPVRFVKAGRRVVSSKEYLSLMRKAVPEAEIYEPE